MATSGRRKRVRGEVEELPSGSLSPDPPNGSVII